MTSLFALISILFVVCATGSRLPFNQDDEYGNQSGYKFRDEDAEEKGYESVGCYEDKFDRAIPGFTEYPTDVVIQKCYERAKKEGNDYFAVEFKVECYTNSNAAQTYNRYGTATGCVNGRGAQLRMDVYKVLKGGNECAQGTHECDDNADCIQAAGSYTCQCRTGYKGDGKTCKADNNCNWITGNGEGYDFNWIGYITQKACIAHCTNEMNKGSNVNGATVYNGDHLGCWCVQKMTHISTSSEYKTCFLKPIKQETYTCNYEPGDGEGTGNYWIGYFKKPECMKQCAERRNTGWDTRVNGATVYAGDYPGCWCEYGMTYIDSSDTSYKTCFLKPVQG